MKIKALISAFLISVIGYSQVTYTVTGGSGLTSTQTDQLEGLYGVWYELMTGDEDGAQDAFLDLNGERRNRVGYVEGLDARTITLDNAHELGRKYMYYVSSAGSSITLEVAESAIDVVFEGQGDSQTGDQILVDAMGTHIYFTRIANNLYVLSAEGTVSATDFTPPAVQTASVEDATPSRLNVTFTEDVSTGTLQNLSFTGDLSDVTVTGQNSLSGVNLVLDLSRNVLLGETGNFVYGSPNGISDTNGNLLAAGSTSVTNNISDPNLYTENSAANGGSGVGSWLGRGAGSVTAVSDADFTGGTAIETENGGNQFDGARLVIDDATVTTWSGGTITQLDENDVYTVTFEAKEQGTDASQIMYFSVLINSTTLRQGNIISPTSGVSSNSFDFTVPAGGVTSGVHEIRIASNYQNTFGGWGRFGNFRIEKTTDN